MREPYGCARAPDPEVSSGASCPAGHPRPTGRGTPHRRIPVLDLVYIAGAIVLFALVGLVGRGVEKL
ncbi:hypothetical protein C5E16_07755 [Clavibacter michiganensis]|uniref:Uncharacterized protein n=1 Tax=Clavibacter michiganensis TaxID=28447 RepID=A0A2S5VU03_9MICO|nr:hypothetical protein C5E16_07755 [Clavibacter michiganensis]